MNTTINKFLVALASTVATALSMGLIPDPYKPYVSMALVFLGAIGVYVVPNKPVVPTP